MHSEITDIGISSSFLKKLGFQPHGDYETAQMYGKAYEKLLPSGIRIDLIKKTEEDENWTVLAVVSADEHIVDTTSISTELGLKGFINQFY